MNKAEQLLIDNGYEDVVCFKDFDYDDALIGVSYDNRAIYDFDLMVEWLVLNEGFSELEAVEWIEVNTLRAYPRNGLEPPIVMYNLLY